jgi:hypothetical protein
MIDEEKNALLPIESSDGKPFVPDGDHAASARRSPPRHKMPMPPGRRAAENRVTLDNS